MNNPLSEILFNQNSTQKGVYSVCTANALVIEAAMLHAKKYNYVLVVEATANQVNQFGGYTGMKPTDYYKLVEDLRIKTGLPKDKLILGGDHLGPLTWQNLNEDEAMKNSEELIREFTLAGFTKIHIDTSMRVASDDQNAPLSVSVCARRGAHLATCVRDAYEERKKIDKDAVKPVLIIGSEVPIPGGSKEHEDSITPTSPSEFINQYNTFKEAFKKENVSFDDVVGFVVQPGVEFGDDFACQYNRKNAEKLCASLDSIDNLVFEGHSTDYQTTESLTNMVNDGIKILKVGPALTFALREALFLLEECEKEMKISSPSNIKDTILSAMNSDDKYWKKYYFGTKEEIEYKKLYSYSDRCRYYLPDENISKSIDTLLNNTKSIPHALISQYFPNQYEDVVSGKIKNNGESLLMSRIGNLCTSYAKACGIKI